jgi:hypothetical protein
MSKGLAAPQAELAFAQLHLVACDVVRGMELRVGIRIAQSSSAEPRSASRAECLGPEKCAGTRMARALRLDPPSHPTGD